MKSVFNFAMRKAGELTRTGDLREATKVIQRALSGGLSRQTQPAEKPQAAPELAAPDGGATGAPGGEPSPPQGVTLTARTSRSTLLRRAKMPLGEVVELLRQVKQASVNQVCINAAGVDPLRFDREGVWPAPLYARSAPDGGEEFASRHYSCEAGARDYKLFVPNTTKQDADAGPALVIMLHGCTQDPEDFAAGTKMNALAAEHGFIVGYPKQSPSANQSGCWNWFQLKDQMRSVGEPCIIAGITREIMAEFGVDPARVYIAGLSAGGAMAAVMSATYPDLYAATGIHSGLAYKSASDLLSGLTAMRGKSNPGLAATKYAALDSAHRAMRTIVFHGGSDQTVHPSNGEMIVAEARARIAPGRQHVEDGVSEGGRAYTRTIVTDASGASVVEHWEIEGLAHAWSGGSPLGSYTDPAGPDASREMLRFFFSDESREI